MVSNLTDSVKNAGQGDMAYALKQFFQEGGAAYAAPAAAFTGPLPDDFIQVTGGAQALLSKDDEFAKALSGAKALAISRVPVGMVGSYATVQNLIKEIEGATTIADVQMLAAVLYEAFDSAARMLGEMIDPDQEITDRMNRVFDEMHKLDKAVDDEFDKLDLTDEQKKKLADAAAEVQAAEEAFKKNRTPANAEAAINARRAQHKIQEDLAEDLGNEGKPVEALKAKLEDRAKQAPQFESEITKLADGRGTDHHASVEQVVPAQPSKEQRQGAAQGFAMLSPAPKSQTQQMGAQASETVTNGPAPIVQGKVVLPVLQGVVVSEVDAPEGQQLASLARKSADDLGLTT